MKLSEAKLIQGDVLGVRQKGFFSWFTWLAQYLAGHGDISGITHVGIARKVGEIWCSQEMDGKHCVLRPISQFLRQGFVINVYRPGVIVPDTLLDKYLLEPIKYSIFGLFKIGFHLIFGFNRNGTADKDEMVCSDLYRAILLESGWQGDLYNMPSPSEICIAIGNPAYQIEGE
jgi:hypothetical protein